MFPISPTPHSSFASFSISHRLGKGKINKFKFKTIAGYGFHPQSSWRHKTYYSWLEIIIGFPVLYPNCDHSLPCSPPVVINLPNSCRKNVYRNSAKGTHWEFSGVGLECVALTEVRMLQMDTQAPCNGEVFQAQPALTDVPLTIV